MSLSEDLKSTKFKNEFYKALTNLRYTVSWLAQQEAPVFKKHNIQAQHYEVLHIIKGKGGKPVAPKEIIACLLDKNRDLTRLVDKMVKLGLLSRCICPTNRRQVDISITAEGKKIANRIEKDLERIYNEMRVITDGEAETINELLDEIRG